MGKESDDFKGGKSEQKTLNKKERQKKRHPVKELPG